MAWDDFEGERGKGVTGDKPLDELARALRRVADAYEARFDRKPTLVEILHALETVLAAGGGALLSGPESLHLPRLVLVPATTAAPLRYEDFEGAYSDRLKPPRWLVQRRKTGTKAAKRAVEVFELRASRRVLTCSYLIKDASLTEADAHLLIRQVLLADFCDHHYDTEAEQVDFVNRETGASVREPFVNPW